MATTQVNEISMLSDAELDAVERRLVQSQLCQPTQVNAVGFA